MEDEIGYNTLHTGFTGQVKQDDEEETDCGCGSGCGCEES